MKIVIFSILGDRSNLEGNKIFLPVDFRCRIVLQLSVDFSLAIFNTSDIVIPIKKLTFTVNLLFV